MHVDAFFLKNNFWFYKVIDPQTQLAWGRFQPILHSNKVGGGGICEPRFLNVDMEFFGDFLLGIFLQSYCWQS